MSKKDDQDISFKKSNTGQYIGIIVCVILFCVFTLLYVAASSYNKAVYASSQFVPPASTLTQNLFVAQNSEYAPNASLPLEYHFGGIPYMCDIPEYTYISMGNGTVFTDAAQTRLLYATECYTDELEQAVIDELSQAILATADVSKTQLISCGVDRGYFNGHDTVYAGYEMYVTNGSITNRAFILSYVFPVENTKKCGVVAIVFYNKKEAAGYKGLLDTWAYTYREYVPENQTETEE